MTSFSLQVVQAISDVVVTFQEDIFESGTTHQLIARVLDGNGVAVGNAPLTWTSPKTNVATVSNSGVPGLSRHR